MTTWKSEVIKCHHCGCEFSPREKKQWASYVAGGRVYCGSKCRATNWGQWNIRTGKQVTKKEA